MWNLGPANIKRSALEALTRRQNRKIAKLSKFFEDNKEQPKGEEALQPSVEPKK